MAKVIKAAASFYLNQSFPRRLEKSISQPAGLCLVFATSAFSIEGLWEDGLVEPQIEDKGGKRPQSFPAGLGIVISLPRTQFLCMLNVERKDLCH